MVKCELALVIVDEDYITLRNLLKRTIRHSPMKIYKVNIAFT